MDEPQAEAVVESSTAASDEAARVDRMLAERFSRMHQYKVFRYRCSNKKCGAEDSGTYREEEPNPAMPPAPGPRTWINCWKCGNGFRLKLDVMQNERRGMFAYCQVTHDTGEIVARPSANGEWLAYDVAPTPVDKVSQITGGQHQ